jgi:cytochrome b6-f complex iron-sulfur subunit
MGREKNPRSSIHNVTFFDARGENGMTSEAIPQKINRREFLNLAWLASLGFLTVNLAGITYLFAMPRFKEGEFGGIFTIGRVSDLPATGSAPLNYPKVKLWLSNTEKGVMAIYKVCTHLGCLYNWNEQEGKFACPCHGSQFDTDGSYIRGPAPRSLDRFVVEIVNQEGVVLAATDPETGEPVPVPDDENAIVRVDTGKRLTGPSHA